MRFWMVWPSDSSAEAVFCELLSLLACVACSSCSRPVTRAASTPFVPAREACIAASRRFCSSADMASRRWVNCWPLVCICETESSKRRCDAASASLTMRVIAPCAASVFEVAREAAAWISEVRLLPRACVVCSTCSPSFASWVATSSNFLVGRSRTSSSKRRLDVAWCSSSRQIMLLSSSLMRWRQASSEVAASFVCAAWMASAFDVKASTPERLCEDSSWRPSWIAEVALSTLAKPPSIFLPTASTVAACCFATSSKRSVNLENDSTDFATCSALQLSTFWLHTSTFWLTLSTFWQQMSILVASAAMCCSMPALTRASKVCISWRRCCSAIVVISSSFAVMRCSNARTSLRCDTASFVRLDSFVLPVVSNFSSKRVSICSMAAWNCAMMPALLRSTSSPVERLSCKMVSSAPNFWRRRSSIVCSFWFCSSGSNIGNIPGNMPSMPSMGISAPFLI
mmetsp:Transcript_73624/g.213080  ORF Transcript_73624/g.213080 Transcript_73624/m.213080 type:complete len:456 (-) Transcript_73624:1390-2757(-)